MREGWEVKELGLVVKTGAGGTPLKSKKEYYENGNIPWLLSGEVAQGEIYSSKSFISEKGLINSSAKLFPINSILIAMYGATAGQVGILRFESSTNQAVCGIFPNEKFIPEFLFYFFLSKKEDLLAQATGNAQPNISQAKIKKVLTPIPPLPEQKQIVKTLDLAFGQLDQAKANLEQNLANAKELFASKLNEVFSQRGEGWEEKTLKEVCEKITDGTHQTPKYFDDGIIFLSSRNVTSGKINWDNIKYIDEKQHIAMHKRVAPRVGDILLAKNGTTGVAAMVDRDVVFDIYVSLAHIRVLDEVLPHYMLHFINSPLAKKQFNSRLKGTGVPNLHLKEIRDVIIPFPKSLEEQEQIIKVLNDFSKITKEAETHYQQNLNNLEELKKSILEKAFKGEL